MDIIDGLLTIAQIAATFAGFTALMSLVRSSTDARYIAVTNFRIMMMIVQSMMTLFLCLLPVLLLQTGLEPGLIWVSSNTVLIVIVVLRVIVVIRGIRRVARVHPDVINPVSTGVNFAAAGLSVTAAGTALAVSVGGTHITPLVASYFFGCIAMLVIAAAAFILLVQSLLPQAGVEESGE